MALTAEFLAALAGVEKHTKADWKKYYSQTDENMDDDSYIRWRKVVKWSQHMRRVFMSPRLRDILDCAEWLYTNNYGELLIVPSDVPVPITHNGLRVLYCGVYLKLRPDVEDLFLGFAMPNAELRNSFREQYCRPIAARIAL